MAVTEKTFEQLYRITEEEKAAIIKRIAAIILEYVRQDGEDRVRELLESLWLKTHCEPIEVTLGFQHPDCLALILEHLIEVRNGCH